MATCAFAFTYQVVLAAAEAPPVPRNTYYFLLLVCGGCYAASRYVSRRGDKNASSILHCCLHLFGNISNLLLYDALGSKTWVWGNGAR